MAKTMRNTLILLIVACFLVPRAGISYLSQSGSRDLLRPKALKLCPHSKAIFSEITWVKVRARNNWAFWHKRGKFITFKRGSQGAHTIIKKVRYKGENFRAKMAYNKEDECYIISQAPILKYLNQLDIPGIPKAKHFLQIKIGKGLRRQLRSECGIVNPEEEARVILFEELPEGRTLENVAEKRQMSEVEIIGVALKVAEILKPIHDAGVKHCDVRASNIWIPGKENNPILFDFDFSYKITEKDNPLDALSLVQMLALILTGEYDLTSAINKGRDNISVELLNILHRIKERASKHDYLSVDEFITYFSVFLETKNSLNPSERKQEISFSNAIIEHKTVRLAIDSTA